MILIGENINIMSQTIGPALKERNPAPILELAKAEIDPTTATTTSSVLIATTRVIPHSMQTSGFHDLTQEHQQRK